MNAHQSVFERQEKKYVLTPDQYEQIKTMIDRALSQDQYGRQTIASIYYDDAEFSQIRRSLEKPVYKEKLRIRSYGQTISSDMVYVELKKKFRGIVHKRRTEMPLRKAELFLNGGLALEPNQIEQEILYYCSQNRLHPSIFVAYEREAYGNPEIRGFRLTTDSNIRGRHRELHFSEPLGGERILPAGYVLMEVKTTSAMPLWLSHVLSRVEAFPVSFSKCGAYYRDVIACGTEKEKANVYAA